MRARAAFFRFIRHVVGLEDSRDILSQELDRQNLLSCPQELSKCNDVETPYADLRRNSQSSRQRYYTGTVFITGRFRSGSTLLWNLFRNVPLVTSYYEPFNERRWFDQQLRGGRVDPTHLAVSDYWSEYNGLEELGAYFEEAWKFERLYMPEHAWNPAMERYIQILIDRAVGRAVLQFNEVDMRLPWLRAKFPGMKMLHIYRHPRDQWCSTLQGAASKPIGPIRDFEPLDGFYLLRWGRDLHHYFPFLTLSSKAHPYELFYQIWKLSYLFGRFHADYSIAFEDIATNPRESIKKLLSAVDVQDYDLDALASIVQPVPLGKWRQSPDAERFSSIEAKVDADFASYAANSRDSGQPSQ
jgi:hypothetical protein